MYLYKADRKKAKKSKKAEKKGKYSFCFFLTKQ